MSDLVKAALRALELAEQEMRMAGWTYFQPDNIGRMDAMQAVRDAIAMLTAEPDREAPMPSQVANHFSTLGDHKTSKDFAAMGAQTPFPQSALQDTNCTRIMREQGKAYPRTCPRCGLGPCAYSPQISITTSAPLRELTDEEIIAVSDAMDQFSLMLQDEIVRFARAIIDAARKA